MRTKLLNAFDQISNFKWEIKYYFNFFLNNEFRVLMNSNKKFKKSNKSERCFIVGNGPSLKKMDLRILNKEVVFTVNNIMNDIDLYESLNSDYHVIIDPEYFKLNKDVSEDLAQIDLLKKINYNHKKPICITSYEGKDNFVKNGLNKVLDLNYLYQHKNITDNYSSIIGMNKNFPNSQNVIQCAIFSAMYMGYKEIFLIGCDMTSVFVSFEYSEEGERAILNNRHAYEYSDNELKSMLKSVVKYDNEFILDEYARNFRIFKNIKKYAEKNKVMIINAGVGGGLDVFSRVNFNTLFK
ncbi:6-hydroxymethylpterin diphosphokinase MptE-like protein [Flavobacterium plurextorum]|uniref:6-hydroxymethylpterin diphosphokinase MptE-like protein n=1 Tax=Flavobacterium plurextorum TaxID=1114867 RepID=UPI0037570971